MDTDVKELFEQYSDMIYRIAISYVSHAHLAEDVVQEVFLRYLGKRPHFENSQHEKAWFIRVTINCCKSMISSSWMKRTCPLEEANQITPLFQQEKERELYEMLLQLPVKYRIVLYLRYYEQYRVNEIAELLHITPNLVSVRLQRAKKIMKQEILKEMGDFEDGTGII